MGTSAVLICYNHCNVQRFVIYQITVIGTNVQSSVTLITLLENL